MKTLPRNIFARPHGYEVQIKRRDLKWRVVVPYSHPDALAEAVRLRDRFYKLCGPITRKTSRSNTDVIGITETTHWQRGHEYRKFNVHVGGRNKGFYFGRRCSREQAFNAAVAHRAQATGVKPATLLPLW